MSAATPEVRRRRWFHGWTFERERDPSANEALRHWLATGERVAGLSAEDLQRIERFEAFEALDAASEHEYVAVPRKRAPRFHGRCKCGRWFAPTYGQSGQDLQFQQHVDLHALIRGIVRA